MTEGGDALDALAAKAEGVLSPQPWQVKRGTFTLVDAEYEDVCELESIADLDYIASFHPGVGAALVKIAQAAREIATNEVEDIDERLRYVYLQPDRDEVTVLVAALAELERVLGTEEK